MHENSHRAREKGETLKSVHFLPGLCEKKKKNETSTTFIAVFFGVDFLAHLSLEKKKKKLARYFLSN